MIARGFAARFALGAVLGFAALSPACALGADTGGIEAVTLRAGTASIPLDGHVAELADETGAWTLDDMRTSERAAKFETIPDLPVAHGYSGFAYWYRLTLHNPQASAETRWVLEIQRPVLDYVDVYVTRADGTTESVLTGDKRPPDPGQLSHRTFAVPLHVTPGETVTVHVRAQSAGAHLFRMTVWTRDAFHAHVAEENFTFGAFFGALVLMLLYNSLIFVWIRDRAYLFYTLMLAAAVGMGLSFTGYARDYANGLFAGAPDWINASALVFGGTSMGLMWLFLRELFDTRRHAPWLHRIANVTAAASMLTVVAYPLLGFTLTDQILDVLQVVGAPVLLSATTYLALKGLRTAQFFLLAWTASILIVVLWILQSVGVLPVGTIGLNAWMLAYLFGLAVLSLALGDRITSERRARDAATDRANRLKSFLPQEVAELVGAGDKALLAPKRREVTVCVIDLRGFTPFSETSAPEDVMNVLREFYETMGAIVARHGGTVEHFAGDSMLIFFNAPLEVPNPEEHAVLSALAMRQAFASLRTKWAKRGHELGLGIGIADGFATIGAIGFAGRSQYAAIGAVTNLASRLCSSAVHGEILATARVIAAVEATVEAQSIGEQSIKGFHRPVQVMRLLGLKSTPAQQAAPQPALP